VHYDKLWVKAREEVNQEWFCCLTQQEILLWHTLISFIHGLQSVA
jgi:hypothetical protein